MKYLILLISLSTIGCGMAEDLTKACKGAMDQFCDMTLGQDPENVEQLQQDVKALNERLDQLELLVDNNISTLNFLSSQGSNNSVLVEHLQTQTNSMVSQLAIFTLKDNDPVVGYIDPCGDGDGYDEFLMKTRDGKYIAYFQDGNGNNQKRFLTVLGDGDYQTTDGQQCEFSIVNGEYQR